MAVSGPPPVWYRYSCCGVHRRRILWELQLSIQNLAIAGLGKIARDQHLAAIAATADFALCAVADPHERLEDVAHFASIEALLAARSDVDAVAVCTPPQLRFAVALAALSAGRHVLLEKPPAASMSEAEALVAEAGRRGVILFAAWHSRFAQGVAPAKDWLCDKTVRRADIVWREDVRRWHPGQKWIWRTGGLGVFDPGINAISILTEILPESVILTGAELDVPDNCDTPIAAQLALATLSGAPVSADFDFLQTGPQTWTIRVETEEGTLLLSDGGATLRIDGVPLHAGADTEYAALYARFADLIGQGVSDADLHPLQLVADAFLCGTRRTVEAFIE